jgi:alpha-L-rhamnosidase
VAVLTPRALYDAYGARDILEASFDSMRAWLDRGVVRGDNGLWDSPRDGYQLADW